MAWQDRDYYREESTSHVGARLSAMSVTLWLIIINSVVFVLDTILTGSARANVLSPSAWGEFTIPLAIGQLQLWRFFTYQFLHANIWHILFNMIGLYFFGPMMENWWGARRYLAFYLLCGMCGAAVYAILSSIPGIRGPWMGAGIVGASGSIYGILVGCAVVAPDARVMLLFPPIPMSLRTFALVFLGIAVLSVLVGAGNAGGEAAHLGGAALGFLLVKQPLLLGWAQGWRRHRHVRRLKPNPLRRWWEERKEKEIEREDAAVDRILAKVKEHGLHSLSEHEKKTLHRATERQRRGE